MINDHCIIVCGCESVAEVSGIIAYIHYSIDQSNHRRWKLLQFIGQYSQFLYFYIYYGVWQTNIHLIKICLLLCFESGIVRYSKYAPESIKYLSSQNLVSIVKSIFGTISCCTMYIHWGVRASTLFLAIWCALNIPKHW